MVFTGSTGSQDRNDYLVKAGWIYRPDSGLSEGVSVLVHGGIIKAVIDSADIDTDLKVIDHTSDIIVPSFCDYHVHFFDKDLKDSRASSNAINDSGISLVYEGGSTSLAGIDAIDLFEPNITIKASGYAISKKGGYGGYLGKDVGSIGEAMELIDDLNKKGVDYIKVINSGIVDLETGEITAGGFESEELKKLIAYAGSLGLEVFCHANGDNAIRDAIVAGAKAIIHGFMISDDSLVMMKENSVFFIPTIAALSHLNDIAESGEAATVINRLVEDHLAAIKKAYDMGVKVLSGSDSGSRSLPHGLTFLEELNLFHKAGLDIEEVLSVAVAGTIQIGQQADLVAIEGPPFEKGEILIAGRYR